MVFAAYNCKNYVDVLWEASVIISVVSIVTVVHLQARHIGFHAVIYVARDQSSWNFLTMILDTE